MKRRRDKQMRKLYFLRGAVDNWPENERGLLRYQKPTRRPVVRPSLSEGAATVWRSALSRLKG